MKTLFKSFLQIRRSQFCDKKKSFKFVPKTPPAQKEEGNFQQKKDNYPQKEEFKKERKNFENERSEIRPEKNYAFSKSLLPKEDKKDGLFSDDEGIDENIKTIEKEEKEKEFKEKIQKILEDRKNQKKRSKYSDDETKDIKIKLLKTIKEGNSKNKIETEKENFAKNLKLNTNKFNSDNFEVITSTHSITNNNFVKNFPVFYHNSFNLYLYNIIRMSYESTFHQKCQNLKIIMNESKKEMTEKTQKYFFKISQEKKETSDELFTKKIFNNILEFNSFLEVLFQLN